MNQNSKWFKLLPGLREVWIFSLVTDDYVIIFLDLKGLGLIVVNFFRDEPKL